MWKQTAPVDCTEAWVTNDGIPCWVRYWPCSISCSILCRDGGASDPNPLLCRNCRVLQFRQRHHGDLAGVIVKAWVEAALVSFGTIVVELADHGVDP